MVTRKVPIFSERVDKVKILIEAKLPLDVAWIYTGNFRSGKNSKIKI
jgi:hypothetical protein